MSFFSKLIKGVLGMDDSTERAAREAAQRAEEQLRQQQEIQKLQATNEMQNVTTVTDDASVLTGNGTDNRRRKRTGGQAVSNLGLNI